MYRPYENENRIERREDIQDIVAAITTTLTRRLINRMNVLENTIMSQLTDMVAQAAQDNTDLQADVTRLTDAFAAQTQAISDLQAQVDALNAAGAGATPEEVAALQAALDGIHASNLALDQIAPTTTPAP